MKVTGGAAKGRALQAPKSPKTRPLTDRGRAGLFNLLGDISSLSFLDAYAGSGAIGLEALSRGAKAVTGIEIAFPAAKIIKQNAINLGYLDSYDLKIMAVEDWLKRFKNGSSKFDIIFAGPPFEKFDAEVIAGLVGFLKPQGLLVVEHFRKYEPPPLENAKYLDSRRFGESLLSFYRKL